MSKRIVILQRISEDTNNFLQGVNLLQSVRQWLESIEIREPKLARLLCKIIPAHCPFDRKIKLFGVTIFRIPPLCKVNPMYQEMINLRYKSLSFLVDECYEDVTHYH